MVSKTEEVAAILNSVSDILHCTYQHYKGGVYFAYNAVLDCTTGKPMIVYYRVAGPDFDRVSEEIISYARLASEFDNWVVLDDGKIVKRFVKVEKIIKTVYEPVDVQ